MKEAPDKRTNSFASLVDNVVIEILHRHPSRSLFCCKMVCKSWKRLISDPKYLKLLPQTMAGFIYDTNKSYRHFSSVTGIELSFEFLPMDNVAVSDYCNGLILCWCCVPNGYRYVVCNPATQWFRELPPSNHSVGEARLAFDPTASSHFHVIEYIEEEGECVVVDIYSSETTTWISKECGWGSDSTNVTLVRSTNVFLNSCLHKVGYWGGYCHILAMDVKENKWRKIPRSDGIAASIHQTQGHLCVCTVDRRTKSQLSVWVLEDHNTNEWILKHTASAINVFGKTNIQFGHEEWDEEYIPITVHPEWKMIFFAGEARTIITYDMDNRKVHVVPARVFSYVRRLVLTEFVSRPVYLPYVPLLSESLAEE